MDYMEEAALRLKRKNQILFSREGLWELDLLLRQQNRRTVVCWAFEMAEDILEELSARLPGEERPAGCLAAARRWAAGEIKMPEAKKAILACHAAAKELPPHEAALCHALAQGCSVVHTSGHAMGLPIYELTALVRRDGLAECRPAVKKRLSRYLERLSWWASHPEAQTGPWAKFLERT